VFTLAAAALVQVPNTTKFGGFGRNGELCGVVNQCLGLGIPQNDGFPYTNNICCFHEVYMDIRVE